MSDFLTVSDTLDVPGCRLLNRVGHFRRPRLGGGGVRRGGGGVVLDVAGFQNKRKTLNSNRSRGIDGELGRRKTEEKKQRCPACDVPL